MRLNLLELAEDVALDPSFIELIQTDPLSMHDFISGLAWLVGWTIASQIAIAALRRHVWPAVMRLTHTTV